MASQLPPEPQQPHGLSSAQNQVAPGFLQLPKHSKGENRQVGTGIDSGDEKRAVYSLILARDGDETSHMFSWVSV